jgi:hypothetical protein
MAVAVGFGGGVVVWWCGGDVVMCWGCGVYDYATTSEG